MSARSSSGRRGLRRSTVPHTQHVHVFRPESPATVCGRKPLQFRQ
jgi:hypothetical protein